MSSEKLSDYEYEKRHLPFGLTLDKEAVDKCAECGKQFYPLKQGKLRMGESFCSIECADKAYPSFRKQ